MVMASILINHIDVNTFYYNLFLMQCTTISTGDNCSILVKTTVTIINSSFITGITSSGVASQIHPPCVCRKLLLLLS